MTKRKETIQEKIKMMYPNENLTDTQVEMLLDDITALFAVGCKIAYRELYQNNGR